MKEQIKEILYDLNRFHMFLEDDKDKTNSKSFAEELRVVEEELTALIEPNDRETILREFTNALENEVYFKGSKTTNTLIAVFADEFRPIICRVLDKFLKEKK